jgi:uncharacterized protein YkwD
MKLGHVRCCLSGVLAVISLAGSGVAAAGREQPDMSAAERAVVDELSLARTKPQDYAKLLEQYRRHFKADGTVVTDGDVVQTKEGVRAVDEAIAFLKKAKPLSAVTGSRPLTLAARDHVQDTGPAGLVGHNGADGSTFADRIARYGKVKTTAGENIAYGPSGARSIVMQLIIDDGVANRGHRTNIYNPDFRTVGIAIGAHKVYEGMCVMDFADAVTEKSESEKRAEARKASARQRGK